MLHISNTIVLLDDLLQALSHITRDGKVATGIRIRENVIISATVQRDKRCSTATALSSSVIINRFWFLNRVVCFFEFLSRSSPSPITFVPFNYILMMMRGTLIVNRKHGQWSVMRRCCLVAQWCIWMSRWYELIHNRSGPFSGLLRSDSSSFGWE